jgi:hypothetical protein
VSFFWPKSRGKSLFFGRSHNPSTCSSTHLNTCTSSHQHINTSTHQHIITSSHQHKSSTHQHKHQGFTRQKELPRETLTTHCHNHVVRSARNMVVTGLIKSECFSRVFEKNRQFCLKSTGNSPTKDSRLLPAPFKSEVDT